MKRRVEHLYVHIPFCTHICPYCAFFKHKNDMPSMKAFIPAFRNELAWALDTFDLQPRTIYFGGGTPSALSITQLEKFFSDWPWRSTEEFTFECNPSTVSLAKARFLRSVGVSRISLGVQAFDPAFLKLLGRTHDRTQIRQTMDILRTAGFDNINIDLMFALPGQALEHWLETINEAADLSPEHISAYNLTYEEDTSFFEKLEAGLWKYDESDKREYFLQGIELLEAKGFTHYEVSNFARSEKLSTHNLAYWQGADYLGLGPSACSTLGDERWQNVSDTLAYARSTEGNGQPDHSTEKLSERAKLAERIFLGLRTQFGVDEADIAPWSEEVNGLLVEGLAKMEKNRLILTRQGMAVADMISEIFV